MGYLQILKPYGMLHMYEAFIITKTSSKLCSDKSHKGINAIMYFYFLFFERDPELYKRLYVLFRARRARVMDVDSFIEHQKYSNKSMKMKFSDEGWKMLEKHCTCIKENGKLQPERWASLQVLSVAVPLNKVRITHKWITHKCNSHWK